MIIDLIILAVFGLEIYRGWKRGFIYSAGVIALVIAAFILANIFAGPLASYIYSGADKKGVGEKLEVEIHKNLDRGENPLESMKAWGIPEAYREMILKKDAGIFSSWQSLVEESTKRNRELIKNTAESMARTFLEIGARALAFLLIFFGSFFILRLILKLVSSGVNKLPVLGGANRLLGIGLGLLTALVICGVILSLLPGVAAGFPQLKSQLESSKLGALISNSAYVRSFLDIIF